MASFLVERVTALPGLLAANTLYLVATGTDHVEVYVTGNTAVARRVFNEADVEALIDSRLAGVASVQVVADIAARDALQLTENTQVMVLDASADATVDSGAATYIYRASNDTFTKISEAESLDLALQWAAIVGRPNSSAAQIDAAVAALHTHANKSQLDKIGQNAGGDFTYDGREYVRSGSADW
jgi:hypothetical protein